VRPVFEERLREARPLAAEKVLHRIRETRGGDRLYDPRFGVRGRGQGPYADMIAGVFAAHARRLGYQGWYDGEADDDGSADEPTTFRRPAKPTPQLSLF
jgi:hypothetical protein